MLSVRIEKALREFRLEVAFEVNPSETLVIIGPSGCGKTTTLNAIAGLVRLDEGRIAHGERTLWDRSTWTVMPVEKRDVGYVFQDFALFPHLSVAENVAYGLRARHAPSTGDSGSGRAGLASARNLAPHGPPAGRALRRGAAAGGAGAGHGLRFRDFAVGRTVGIVGRADAQSGAKRFAEPAAAARAHRHYGDARLRGCAHLRR